LSKLPTSVSGIRRHKCEIHCRSEEEKWEWVEKIVQICILQKCYDDIIKDRNFADMASL